MSTPYFAVAEGSLDCSPRNTLNIVLMMLQCLTPFWHVTPCWWLLVMHCHNISLCVSQYFDMVVQHRLGSEISEL